MSKSNSRNLSRSTILKEYKKANAWMKKLDTHSDRREEMRGVQQALAWVLRNNAMAPVKAAML